VLVRYHVCNSLILKSQPQRHSFSEIFKGISNDLIIIIIIIMATTEKSVFLFQRLSVLIQRYNAILLHDCFVKEEEE